MIVQSKFALKLLFISLNFAFKDCEASLGQAVLVFPKITQVFTFAIYFTDTTEIIQSFGMSLNINILYYRLHIAYFMFYILPALLYCRCGGDQYTDLGFVTGNQSVPKPCPTMKWSNLCKSTK